ncbi:DUF6020 family protein [Cystobacter fuscus]|uniref:DUF6020 family protein n=1 Tax=Cystobacter fuscus TaxID=43 RepID=UPI0037BFF483
MILAIALATTAVLRLGPEAVLSPSVRGWCVGALALLLYRPLSRWGLGVLDRHLQRYSARGRWAWILGSLLGAALLIVAIPLPPPPLSEPISLEVTATGEKNAASHGTEVWVIGLQDAESGAPLVLTPVSGAWEQKNDKQLSFGRPAATLRWDGRAERGLVLKVIRHPWSGQARITLGGETHTVDLFAPLQEEWSHPLQTPTHVSGLLVVFAWLAEWISLGLLLLGLGGGLASGSWAGHGRQPGRRTGWAPASVCVMVWSLYLLAFWPGIMTVDSINQWTQMTQGPLSNLHPVYHTLTNWLLTRVWTSPAAVALAQVLALAAAFGFAQRELSRWGVPTWMRGLLTGVFALTPVNGILVVTLWKDIAYGISFLVLFTLLLKVARTRGEVLHSLRFRSGLGVTLTYTALLRHNGVPVVLLLLGLLVLISPRPLRRHAGLLSLAVVGTLLLMLGPLSKALGVRPMSPVFSHIFPIHHLGAIVHAAPDSLQPSEQRLLEELQPLEVWRDDYSCYAINPLIFNGRLNEAFFDTPRRQELVALWLRQVPRHWRVLAHHQRCVTSLIWRILPPAGGYMYLFSLESDPNPFGFVQEPRWPALKETLTRFLKGSSEPERLWWIWRPALYLYLTLFFALIAAARLRSPWILLSIVPVLLNSLVLLGINIAQDFRYQYPVYAVALLSPAFLFMRREQDGERPGGQGARLDPPEARGP